MRESGKIDRKMSARRGEREIEERGEKERVILKKRKKPPRSLIFIPPISLSAKELQKKENYETNETTNFFPDFAITFMLFSAKFYAKADPQN